MRHLIMWTFIMKLSFIPCILLWIIGTTSARHSKQWEEHHKRLLAASTGAKRCVYIPGRQDGYVLGYSTLRPSAWLAKGAAQSGDGHEFKYFIRINQVLINLGFIFGDESSDWMLLHSLPDKMGEPRNMHKVPLPNANQKINFMPGLISITKKENFLSHNISGMLKGFKLPEQIREFTIHVKANPEKKWLSKGEVHLGMAVKLIKNPITATLSFQKMAVQEFVMNPFLIDERKFDIAVYAVITSINPLRVYMDSRDWFVRFDPFYMLNVTEEVINTPYYPFDEDNIDSYIVRFPTPISELKIFEKDSDDFKPTTKELLLLYLQKLGVDPEIIKGKIRERIYTTFMEGEESILDMASQQYIHDPTRDRSYYEYVRFDMLLDANLNLHICEVQGPPVMTALFRASRKERYDRFFYNLLNLVSVAPYNEKSGHKMIHETIAAVGVSPEYCITAHCSNNCDLKECDLCSPCLSNNDRTVLQQTYTEHIKRTVFERVIPRPFKSQTDAVDFTTSQKLSEEGEGFQYKNNWLRRWFAVKCIQDETWC